ERAADGTSLRFWSLATGEARAEPLTFDEPLVRLPGEPGIERVGIGHPHDLTFSHDGHWMTAVVHETFGIYANKVLLPRVEIHLLDTRTGRRVQRIVETNVTDHDENLVSGLAAMVVNTNRLVIRRLAS